MFSTTPSCCAGVSSGQSGIDAGYFVAIFFTLTMHSEHDHVHGEFFGIRRYQTVVAGAGSQRHQSYQERIAA